MISIPPAEAPASQAPQTTDLHPGDIRLMTLAGRPLLVQRTIDEDYTRGFVEVMHPDTGAPLARASQETDGSRSYETFGQPMSDDVLAWLQYMLDWTFNDPGMRENEKLESLAGSLSARLGGIRISTFKKCAPVELVRVLWGSVRGALPPDMASLLRLVPDEDRNGGDEALSGAWTGLPEQRGGRTAGSPRFAASAIRPERSEIVLLGCVGCGR